MTASVVVFARQPVPGRVKTRLAEGIGAGPATSVYTALLDHTLASVRRPGVEIVVSLAEKSESSWARALGSRVETQGRGDLGERMAECFRRRFAEGISRALIVGSDNARLEPEHITAGFAALDDHRAVFGPAADGGYWLVGQRAPGADLFSGIPWSTPETMALTRDRLRRLRVEWTELETLSDIDTEEDLRNAIEDARVPAALRRSLASASHSARDETS